ncbi:MAG: hypothetical protein LQ351_006403 [Letrouitia transgressa]|nr:MAG: hypothetical protein LQ351_006403 [Letrouitia transgressa]
MAYSIPRRKLLREISQTFSNYEFEESGHKVVILLGMGGQEKTRLAFDYARQVSTESDSVLVLRFDVTSKQSLKRGFKNMADRWNGRRRKFADANPRMDYVNEVLAEREWLLIFDNYDHTDHFADISTFLSPGHGSVLIKSRHSDAGKVVRISGMDEAESLELLRHRTEETLKDPFHQAAAINVLQIFGLLPLAIDQAGAYICQQRVPIHMFLQK